MDVSLRDLLAAGAHFGHRSRFWNPRFAPYLFTRYKGIHIIDLEKTRACMQLAHQAVKDICANGHNVLFVGTKRAARPIIVEEARRVKMPYVDQRWLGGLMTNWRTVRRSISRLEDLEMAVDRGDLAKRSKKEVQQHNRELRKLRRAADGIRKLTGPPAALFLIDVKNERLALSEARKMGIPVVAVVDSNSDPSLVDHVIPGNDDSAHAIRIFVSFIADACLEGAEEYRLKMPRTASAEPVVDYRRPEVDAASVIKTRPAPEVEPGAQPESEGGEAGAAPAGASAGPEVEPEGEPARAAAASPASEEGEANGKKGGLAL